MKEISTMNQGVQRKPAKSKSRAITSVALAVAMVAGGLASLPAEALVLGQVRVLSSLGEPLKAEIPITQLSKDEAASLMVALASPSDFSSRGLIYTSSLASIRVSFETTGSNTAVIYMRSARPMQDPFVDLLMDVRWRSGSVQRSYTMLLDPPPTLGTTSPNAIVPAGSEITPDGNSIVPIVTTAQTDVSVLQTPGSGSAPAATTTADGVVIRERVLAPGEGAGTNRPTAAQTAAQTSQPAQTTRPAQTSTAPSTRPSVSGSSSDLHVRVERGQTLGKIANSVKPAGVTTEQMLAALYKANPSAFIDNNINWLRSGATLRIPSDDEIAAISKTEARSLVSSHARAFNQRRTQMSGSTPTVAPVAPTPSQGGAQPVLPLPTPAQPSQTDNVLQIQPDQGGGDQTVAANSQTREDLTRATEVQGHGTELGNIQSEMNGGAGTAPAGTPTTGPTVDASTGTIVEGGAEPVEPTGPLVVPDPAGEPDQLTPEAQRAEDERIAAEEEARREAERIAAEEEQARIDAEREQARIDAQRRAEEMAQTPAPAPLDRGLLDQLLDEPLIPAAALGVVVLLVGGIFVIRRRKKSSSNDEDDSFFEETDDSYYDGEEPEGDSFMLDQSSSIYAASQLDANADVDPVQEADVYLAYGRDEQAAEILRDALSSEPDRVALHAKLCEVYARQNDIIAFEEQAMRLHSLTKGVGFEWERIARLAQSISPNKIGVLGAGSDIPDTKPPASSAPTQMNVPPVLHDDADTQPMDFMGSESGPGFGDAPKNDAFSDLDVSLDFSKSVNPQFDGDSFSDSSSDAPSFSMDDDDEEEGPMTRLALAEEFFAIGNKEDAKEIIEEVMKQNLSDEDRKRASSLLDKVS